MNKETIRKILDDKISEAMSEIMKGKENGDITPFQEMESEELIDKFADITLQVYKQNN